MLEDVPKSVNEIAMDPKFKTVFGPVGENRTDKLMSFIVAVFVIRSACAAEIPKLARINALTKRLKIRYVYLFFNSQMVFMACSPSAYRVQ